MSSKWKIWDFLKEPAFKMGQGRAGIYAFQCEDPIFMKLIVDKLRLNSEQKLFPLMGKEVNLAWLEQEWDGMDLFAENRSYLVHHAEEMGQQAWQLILERMPKEAEKSLYLAFRKWPLAFNKELKAKKCDDYLTRIEETKFWEGQKVLDCLMIELDCPLSYPVREWLLETKSNEPSDLFHYLGLIKQNFEETSKAEVPALKELLGQPDWDMFALASLFTQKKWSQFFAKIIEVEPDFDELRSLFSYLQIHLIKILDPSYSDKKNYISKVDKEIKSFATHWSTAEILKILRKLGEWEILAKGKKFNLKEEMRLSYLKSF